MNNVCYLRSLISSHKLWQISTRIGHGIKRQHALSAGACLDLRNEKIAFSFRQYNISDMWSHSSAITEALATLGDLLAERGEACDILVIGGGALLLSGLITRPTEDLDVVARLIDGGLVAAQPLPEFLLTAIVEVGEALGLEPNWLNAGPAGMVKFQLPEGIEARWSTHSFASLTVRVASRWDLVHFKVFAAADYWPGKTKHTQDLVSLRPTLTELAAAEIWIKTQDSSQGFLPILQDLLRALREGRY